MLVNERQEQRKVVNNTTNCDVCSLLLISPNIDNSRGSYIDEIML